MKISDDVRKAARKFGVDPALIQAVVIAEGNIIKAVQCSFPGVTDEAQALEITCRSAAHALSDYVKMTDPEAFAAFWGARWAPVGARNDPNGLNANWPRNVFKNWIQR